MVQTWLVVAALLSGPPAKPPRLGPVQRLQLVEWWRQLAEPADEARASAARTALLAGGEGSLEVLLDSLYGPASKGDPVPHRELAKLLAQLGAEQFEVREAATQQLRLLGPTAVPFLKRNRAHPDLEVRRRVKVLLAGA